MPVYRPKILFILGTSRCGSTLLDNILGQVDGFLSVGELRFLWRRMIEGRICGCGEGFDACPLWTRVLADVGNDLGPDYIDAERVLSWQESAVKLKHTPALLRKHRDDVRPGTPLSKYRDVLAATYRALAREPGTRIIVDSSKTSSGAALLNLMEDVDYFLVHLVRDPRGVSYSEMIKKVNPDRPRLAYMPRAGTGITILRWLMGNAFAEATCRTGRGVGRMRLRYEDYIADAPAAVEEIVAMVEENVPILPFVEADQVYLGSNHTVSGNPSRFVTGRVELRPDIRWISRLPPIRKWATTVACSPLLLRYGYPVFYPNIASD